MENKPRVIRLVNAFSSWWWVNMTDNEPPASNREFDTKSEAIRNVESRVKGKVIFEEVPKTRVQREEY